MDEQEVSKAESEEATWREVKKWQGRAATLVGVGFCIGYIDIRHLHWEIPATAEWFFHSVLFKPILLPIVWVLLVFTVMGFIWRAYWCAHKGGVLTIEKYLGSVGSIVMLYPFAVLIPFIAFFELLMFVIP
ncbi:MAG: hypothetical protein KOO62_13450 [candidate division Zixibacteria bacterium]|nr:hypothetical protein [candidate division Zixibacteria bacterium]